MGLPGLSKGSVPDVFWFGANSDEKESGDDLTEPGIVLKLRYST